MVEWIVSMLASGTEIVYAIGAGDRLIGISHECDYPPEAINKQRITRTRINEHASSAEIDAQVRALLEAGEPLYEVNRKALQLIWPSVIITQEHCDVCAVDVDDVMKAIVDRGKLPQPTVVALNPTSLDGIFEDIRKVGQAVGAVEAAGFYVEHLQKRINAIRDITTVMPTEQRPRVACIEWIEPLMIAANWMPDLIEIAGGRNTLTKSGDRSGYTKWDDVRAFDPEVVVIMPCGFDIARAKYEAAGLEKLPGWSDLSAVRNGRVFAVDGNAYFNRSGPRIVDSLEILAALVHPSHFAGLRPDLDKTAVRWP